MIAEDFSIETLGERLYKSPVRMSRNTGDYVSNYVTDDDLIYLDIHHKAESQEKPILVETAGPRENLFFDPKNVRAAIVTCGGLSPGLNNVIRTLYLTLYEQYGIKRVYGIKFGYLGLLPEGDDPILLKSDFVEDINNLGGTILGTSRGNGKRTVEIVDTLQEKKINIIFVIGGDGTQRGARDICEEAKKRDYKLSVIGIPKTIDNDLDFVDRTFGFETAVEKSTSVIKAAHVEAKSVANGIGLVKLMGRDSGFIAANATIASDEVNYIFVPEIPFKCEGPNSFFPHLVKRLKKKSHAVIVIAEGVGQDRFSNNESDIKLDASGNKVLNDIGQFFKNKMSKYLSDRNINHKVIYIDPSYYIRGVPANSSDSILCSRLAQNAVHAAMSGKTNMVISQLYSRFVHLPISAVTQKRKVISPDGDLWCDVVHSTGQPPLFL